jgi:3-methyladenine DNA glycosylase AlkD
MMAKAKLTPFERWDLGLLFIQDVQNWEICDQLCMALLGQALAEAPAYMNEIETWVEDDDLWIRRAAVVTPILLRRAKYQSDLALELDRRTLAICKALIDDGEKYIRKAVDWPIREVIGRNYDLARDWMIEQAAGLPSKISRSTLKKAAKKLMPADYDTFICIIEGKI